MELRVINFFLLIIAVILIFNIFFNIGNLTSNVIKEQLSCEINGKFIDNVGLCCHEMQMFLSCENGECVNKNYKILADKKMLKYCKRNGYDVKF